MSSQTFVGPSCPLWLLLIFDLEVVYFDDRSQAASSARGTETCSPVC
jgi:hypothetical protein